MTLASVEECYSTWLGSVSFAFGHNVRDLRRVGARKEKADMMQAESRIPCFLVDYGVFWDCNIACAYCRTNPIRTGTLPGHDDDRITGYLEGLDRVTQYVDAVMFKTSGWGEITRLAGYEELFVRASALGFSVLQLITNGVSRFSARGLSALSSLGHFSIQFSLDGLTLAENRYRFGSNERLLDQVFDNIELALSLGIPVEINTVLTDINTGSLRPFLHELLRLRERHQTPVVCVPRRVRVKRTLQNHGQIPTPDDVDQLASLVVGEFNRFDPVLPPKKYLERLIFNLHEGRRNWTTYDALVRVNIGASGDIVLHTVDGNRDLGTIYGDNAATSFAARAASHAVDGEKDYQTKMTQFDVHYLYLGGHITLAELSRIPSCNNPPAHQQLKYLRGLVIADKPWHLASQQTVSRSRSLNLPKTAPNVVSTPQHNRDSAKEAKQG